MIRPIVSIILLLMLSVQAGATERLLVVGGGLTEIVYALGAGGRITAVDTTSSFPSATSRLPKVGYQRALAAEGVLSMAPTLILATADAGPPAVLAQIRRAGITIDQLVEDFEPASVPRRIRRVGDRLDLSLEAELVARAVEADLATVASARPDPKAWPRVVFLLTAGRGAPMVSGRGTAAAAILTAAGGRNVVTSFVGYRPLSPEIAAQADPDVVVTTEQTLQSIGGPTALLALPGLGGAGGRPRVVAVDALLLLGFGPRIAHAIKGLMGELHGAERLPNLPMRAWVENR